MSDLVARLGAALTNRYRVERELGRGGMAVPSAITVPAGETWANFTITIVHPVIGIDCAVVTATDIAGNKNSVILKITENFVSPIT